MMAAAALRKFSVFVVEHVLVSSSPLLSLFHHSNVQNNTVCVCVCVCVFYIICYI